MPPIWDLESHFAVIYCLHVFFMLFAVEARALGERKESGGYFASQVRPIW